LGKSQLLQLELTDWSQFLLQQILKNDLDCSYLNLTESTIGDQGARQLADAIKSSTIVKYINISGNKIGKEGAQYLAEALKSNRSIKTL